MKKQQEFLHRAKSVSALKPVSAEKHALAANTPPVLRLPPGKTCVFVWFFLFTLPLFPAPQQSTTPHFWDQADNAQLADTLVNAMTDNELLGQLFFLGYQGMQPSNRIITWIRERNLGGVKIFTRNVTNLPALSRDIHTMQKLAGANQWQIPLFMATDQEGGWVRHIKNETLITPGNLALAATGLPNDAYLTGYYIGKELSLIGINMNYAPDVDIYSNPDNSGIGPRAFSSDPIQTGLFALAYYHGMQDAGVICVAKHFPGHGGADLDSHGYLPEVPIDFKTMWERELIPYRFLIKEGLSAIMTGHIAFPEITGDKTPATLSHYFCTDVLRKQLGFKGILMTDSLEMWGVRAETRDFAEISKRAILAGNDMVLIAHMEELQDATWKSLQAFIKTDDDFKKRVKESAHRIISRKLALFKDSKAIVLYPQYENVGKEIAQLQLAYSRDFAFQTACRSVTLIKNRSVPYNKQQQEKLLLLGQYPEFIKEGRARFPGAAFYEFPYAPIGFAPEDEIAKIASLVQKFDTIIFCLANLNSLEILTRIRPYKKKIMVISTLTPVYLDKVAWVETALAVYGTGEFSFKAGFAALAGDFIPGGKLPLKFD